MSKSEGTLLIVLGLELLAAARKHCRAHGCQLSGLIRKLLAREIGQSDLAAKIKMGRPKQPRRKDA